MLRAYIDDSMDSVKQGRVLVMGGFIATPERWEKFSDEWRQRLEHAGWPVFKMNEVWARRNDITLEHAKWHYFTIRARSDRSKRESSSGKLIDYWPG